MQDGKIVELYWKRDEKATVFTKEKYENYCHKVAYTLLQEVRDTEECVNDTWVHTWNAIPPARPKKLQMFVARITRNLAVDRLRERLADKRGKGETSVLLDELAECIPAGETVEQAVEQTELEREIQDFLQGISPLERDVFLRRYFFGEPLKTIGRRYGITENHGAVLLSRTRQKLKRHLEKRGYDV